MSPSCVNYQQLCEKNILLLPQMIQERELNIGCLLESSNMPCCIFYENDSETHKF